MTKTIRIVTLLTICFCFSGAYAADPKPADTKAATPATTTAAPAAPVKADSGKSAPAATTAEPEVKKSKSNICHNKSSPGYKQTKNFTEFKTMDACVKSGGRPPKGNK